METMAMKDLIRKELISDMFETYKYFGITRDIVTSVIDRTLSDEDYNAKNVKKQIEISNDMLFGKSITDVCTYLKSLEEKYGKGTVEEIWSSYEENYFVYEYDSIEDKDELYSRLSRVVYEAILEEKDRMEAEQKRLDRMARIESELATLKEEL